MLFLNVTHQITTIFSSLHIPQEGHSLALLSLKRFDLDLLNYKMDVENLENMLKSYKKRSKHPL